MVKLRGPQFVGCLYRVINSLRENGGHKHVIAFLNHGWLAGSYKVYFIDMERADFTLSDYICYH